MQPLSGVLRVLHNLVGDSVGRLVIECTHVHNPDALTLVDVQVFGGAAIRLFFRGASATAQA